MRLALLLALPLLLAAAPHMQTAEAGVAAPAPCPTAAAPLPTGLAAWKPGASLAAATDAKSLVSAKLEIGTRTEAMLAPSDTVRFPLAPGKSGAPTGMGGMLAFTVTKAAPYRVALGNGAWVDVVKNGKVSTSTAHAHGPACSGIHKMVDFRLTPGRYVLQIENSKDAVVPVLVTRLP